MQCFPKCAPQCLDVLLSLVRGEVGKGREDRARSLSPSHRSFCSTWQSWSWLPPWAALLFPCQALPGHPGWGGWGHPNCSLVPMWGCLLTWLLMELPVPDPTPWLHPDATLQAIHQLGVEIRAGGRKVEPHPPHHYCHTHEQWPRPCRTSLHLPCGHQSPSVKGRPLY